MQAGLGRFRIVLDDHCTHFSTGAPYGDPNVGGDFAVLLCRLCHWRLVVSSTVSQGRRSEPSTGSQPALVRGLQCGDNYRSTLRTAGHRLAGHVTPWALCSLDGRQAVIGVPGPAWNPPPGATRSSGEHGQCKRSIPTTRRTSFEHNGQSSSISASNASRTRPSSRERSKPG